MSTSQKLLTAILSMDAYNRGYNAGIVFESSSIGSANVILQENVGIGASQYQEWQSKGFYAVAYQTDYGTVISYRGTDNPASWSNLNPWSNASGSDVWNGYGTGAGAPLTNASRLAVEFYQAVTGIKN